MPKARRDKKALKKTILSASLNLCNSAIVNMMKPSPQSTTSSSLYKDDACEKNLTRPDSYEPILKVQTDKIDEIFWSCIQQPQTG